MKLKLMNSTHSFAPKQSPVTWLKKFKFHSIMMMMMIITGPIIGKLRSWWEKVGGRGRGMRGEAHSVTKPWQTDLILVTILAFYGCSQIICCTWSQLRCTTERIRGGNWRQKHTEGREKKRMKTLIFVYLRKSGHWDFILTKDFKFL